MKFSKETILGFSMGIAFCIIVVVILAAKGSFVATTISIPQVLSYQGYLTDKNGVPISETKSLTFTLYDKDLNPVWDETQEVSFDDGQFSVYLGEQNPIDAEVLSNPPISLGIKVDGGDELQPPQKLASVAYAMVAVKANDADTLGGKTEGELNVDKVDSYDASDLLNRTNHTGTQAPSSIAPQGPDSGLHADLLDDQHGSFYLNRANHTGTQAPSTISPQGSGSGIDTDTVDGFNAASTPTPNKLLAMDGNGKLPTGALKVYDSGWFPVSANNDYDKTHNLGTTNGIFMLYYSSDSGGTSNVQRVDATFQHEDEQNSMGAVIDQITTTTCRICVGTRSVICAAPSGNSFAYKNPSGYYRLIGIALE